jgi:hypothetical protein
MDGLVCDWKDELLKIHVLQAEAIAPPVRVWLRQVR